MAYQSEISGHYHTYTSLSVILFQLVEPVFRAAKWLQICETDSP